MKVEMKKIVEVEKNNGKNIFRVKSDLFRAKQEGTIFFNQDVSKLTEKEVINLYHSDFSSDLETERNAFPVPNENFILPSDKDEKFTLFKTYYESYYPNATMDHNLFETFNNKPFKAKKCVWFFREEA